jgi:hypothetical protein
MKEPTGEGFEVREEGNDELAFILVSAGLLRQWHAMCYNYSFVWAGVAQSGRAADL